MSGLLRLDPGVVATITLTRGARRNALSHALVAELTKAVEQVQKDGARALILAGEGPAFCAGADFQDLTGGPEDEGFDDAMSALTAALEAGPMLSFAAIHGPCMGAGLDLAMACDFRIAGPEARFALPAVRMAILYTPARLEALSRRISAAALHRLVLLAETLDAAAAQGAGLSTHLVSEPGAEAALAEARRLAEAAAALPPQAQGLNREFLAALGRGGIDREFWQARRREQLASPERRAALAAKKG